ncbi:MAG: Hsp20/alpha crystallin family protein [Candidatus Fimisoma sp.]|jgi:HSP20 family protein|nr:Hsp20/alpha crystallin family protein [Bacillota bacterium]MDD7285132.1 Hsp20/alpha crystallin family protein [Bacillota bacterium]MDY4747457.1 Hsp20/alpha crystallin family protein [Candidatus Fimisoma sp.]
MLMPSIFGENLFDDFMDDFMMNRGARSVQNVMKTDIKETDDSYELKIEMPGYRKEDVKAQLKDGYLTISAETDNSSEEKNEEGKYIRRERYTGAVSRSFFVGKDLTEEDIRARFENGILHIALPKEAPKKIEENKYIAIEG